MSEPKSKSKSNFPFFEGDNDFHVNKFIGAVFLAVSIWLGTSVQSMTVRIAELAATIEHQANQTADFKGELSDMRKEMKEYQQKEELRIRQLEKEFYASQGK